MTDELRQQIAKHALDEYPRESCGLVVNGEYIRCDNASPTPLEDFTISEQQYAAAEDQGDIQALVHSHPGGNPRPSDADLVVCEGLQIPLWVIVSLGHQADGSVDIDAWHEFGPSGYEAPLIGCQFSHGVNDCYGLVRRYYKAKYEIALPDFPRSGPWWDDGKSDLYTQGFPKAGFTALSLSTEPQPGDVLLMKIRSKNNVPNHAAVYIGEDTILHHMYGRLSGRESLPRYRDYVTHILRHNEVPNGKA
ncbi:C40 family peptidase [Robbsia andropogonis]|uniref:C40 family peptidase n=1 Tax=Robbsia andropogonis TaxID=28092 RepID=UPI0038998DFD